MKKIYKSKSFALFGNLKFNLLSFIAVFVLHGATLGQVNAYKFSQLSGTYSEITGGTVLGTATGNTSADNLDSNVYAVTFPSGFVFTFNNINYTSCNVSTNGYITFGITPPGTTLSAPISGVTTYDGAVSAWGGNLSSGFSLNSDPNNTGDIRYELLGSAPNRELVIQWKNFRPNGGTSTTSAYFISFQIRLKETSNEVNIVYNQGYDVFQSTTAFTGNVQIGLRGTSTSDYNNRYNIGTTKFDSSTAGTSASQTQNYNTINSTPGMPPAGLTYVYTPATCYSPPQSSILVSSVTTTSAVVNFNAANPAPSMGYDVYYSTSNVTPSNSVVLDASNSVSTTTTSASLANLTPGTRYYVWVRGKCSSLDVGNWGTSGILFTTLCTSKPIPYYEGFEGLSSGTIADPNAPTCWGYLETPNVSGYGYVINTGANTGTGLFFMSNGGSSTFASDAIILRGPNSDDLMDGTNWVKFFARTSTSGISMQVGTLADPYDPTSFTAFATLPLTLSYVQHNIIIPAGTNKYIAFKLGNEASNKNIYLDDITVEDTPSCLYPSNLNSTSTTGTTISLGWTAPSTTVNNGYTVYYSTTNVAPTTSTVLDASNSATFTGTTGTITGLIPVKTYYIWIKSNCSATNSSPWTLYSIAVSTNCEAQILTSTGQTVCPNASATLTATANSGSVMNWYDDPTAGSLVGTGGSYSTPNLSATTNYYVSATNTVLGTGGAPSTITPNQGSFSANFGIVFDSFNSFVLESTDIYAADASSTSGTITISLLDSTGATIGSTNANVVVNGTGALNTIPLNFNVPVGTGYKLVVTANSGFNRLLRESSSTVAFPYFTSGFANVTSSCTNSSTVPTFYYFFYNLKMKKTCVSARTTVTATVDSNCLATAEVEKEKGIRIYPNPFTDTIMISDVKNVANVSILDMTGRVLEVVQKPSSSIALGHLASGVYTLKVQFKDGKVQTAKAIKK